MQCGNSALQDDGIDRRARADLQAALISYMRGDISAFAFDDRNSTYLWPSETEDHAVREISRVLYGIYDDFIDHPISATPTGWESYGESQHFSKRTYPLSHRARTNQPGRFKMKANGSRINRR